MDKAKALLPDATYVDDMNAVAEGCDALVVATEWDEFIDEARTVEIIEDDGAPVLPGVFYTRVAGASFHDDALQLPHFAAGKKIEIRHEPANPSDRSALAVFGGGHRVGYLPARSPTCSPPREPGRDTVSC